MSDCDRLSLILFFGEANALCYVFSFHNLEAVEFSVLIFGSGCFFFFPVSSDLFLFHFSI